jgi:hypothetical protein
MDQDMDVQKGVISAPVSENRGPVSERIGVPEIPPR